jgi:hypothetical protein
LRGDAFDPQLGVTTRAESASASLRRVITWYFAYVYGVREGPGVLPFYCDPHRVGRFAVKPEALAAGTDAALFKLFVALSMYQARRDVIIMRQQRTMTAGVVASLSSSRRLRQLVTSTHCDRLASAAVFDAGCDVAKAGGVVDCGHRSGLACHVKDATAELCRMGDSGKTPTSAWLHAWKGGGLRSTLEEVFATTPDPTRRADLLVTRFEAVHRVGRKLATMFVGAISMPALAPGLAPWFPAVDGHSLVVVDTHVVRALDRLRPAASPTSYEARVRWVKRQATRIDLREFHPEVPNYAPRIVQQALYHFGSKSNRVHMRDACARRTTPCAECVTRLCPFA